MNIRVLYGQQSSKEFNFSIQSNIDFNKNVNNKLQYVFKGKDELKICDFYFFDL